jgi:hypothetical protein
LLIAQILVHGEENFKTSGSHECEQLAVLLAGPSLFANCADLVSCKLAPERSRDALVK